MTTTISRFGIFLLLLVIYKICVRELISEVTILPLRKSFPLKKIVSAHSPVLTFSLQLSVIQFWAILLTRAIVLKGYCCLRHQNVTEISHCLALWYLPRQEKRPFERNNVVLVIFYFFWVSEQNWCWSNLRHKHPTAGKPGLWELVLGSHLWIISTTVISPHWGTKNCTGVKTGIPR